MSTNLARRERLALCDTFADVGPQAPTLCHPWKSAQLAAHLVLREHRPDLAAGIVLPQLAERTERATQRLAASTPWEALVDQVRSGPPWWHPTRLSTLDDAVNLVEFVIHHEDVLRADGTPGPRRQLTSSMEDGLWPALARMAPLAFRKSPVGVSLAAPGRPPIRAKKGAGVVLEGEVLELFLVAYGRAAVAEVDYSGSDSDVAALRSARIGLV